MCDNFLRKRCRPIRGHGLSNDKCSYSNATAASVIHVATVEDYTEVHTYQEELQGTAYRPARLNLAATCTFEGFVPANNNPDAWRDIETCDLVL